MAPRKVAQRARPAWRALGMVAPLFVLTACATLSARYQLDLFDRTARAYAKAIRWGEFETAGQFLKPSPDRPLPDLKRLRDVRVTSYEPLHAVPSADGNQVEQAVEIKYYYIDSMVEHTLTDRQHWEYAEAKRRWYLTGTLPEFR